MAKTSKIQLEAREAFKKFAKHDNYTDKQKQVFIGTYVRLSNEGKSKEEILEESIKKLRSKPVGGDIARTEYDRVGKRYERNVRKAEKKGSRAPNRQKSKIKK